MPPLLTEFPPRFPLCSVSFISIYCITYHPFSLPMCSVRAGWCLALAAWWWEIFKLTPATCSSSHETKYKETFANIIRYHAML